MWANKVFCKFLLIDIKSPDILLPSYPGWTLESQTTSKWLLVNEQHHTSSFSTCYPHFNIRTGNEDTNPWPKPWSTRKMKRCSNCKTVVCNRWTCSIPLGVARNKRNIHPCFNCKTAGCYFQSCLQSIDDERCKQNTPFFLKSMDPSLKDPPIILSRNRALDIDRHKMAWLETKNKAARLEAKKNLIHHQKER